MESDVLQMVSPYQKRAPPRASSERVMSGKKRQTSFPKPGNFGISPCVPDYESQVVFRCEFDSCLDVFRRSSIDSNDWHTSLLARNAKSSVQVAGLDRPVGKSVCFPVGVFS